MNKYTLEKRITRLEKMIKSNKTRKFEDARDNDFDKFEQLCIESGFKGAVWASYQTDDYDVSHMELMYNLPLRLYHDPTNNDVWVYFDQESIDYKKLDEDSVNPIGYWEDVDVDLSDYLMNNIDNGGKLHEATAKDVRRWARKFAAAACDYVEEQHGVDLTDYVDAE